MKRALAVALLLAAGHAAAEEPGWPQWLGPTRDGRAPAAWAKAPRLQAAWRRPLGPGGASVVVAGGRAFTLFSDEESEFAVALAVADGRELWRTRLDPVLAGIDGGPSSTPLVAGASLVTLSSACQLRALEAATGKPTWHRDLKADFGVELRRGCSTSPLLEGGQLVVQAGGPKNEQRVVGLDPATGRTLWSARGTERTTYTSPVVADIGGVRQLVVHHTVAGPPSTSGLMGLRLSDQSVLWSRPLEKLSFETPLVFPAAGGATVVLPSWTDTQALRVSAEGGSFRAEPHWRTGDLTANVSPPVLRDGYLYGFGGDFLACLEAASGRTVWKERIYPGSLILVGDRLLVLSSTAGLLRVVPASAKGYSEEAKLEVLNRGARTDAPPSFAGGHVFLRNEEEVVAVKVEGS